MEGGHLLAHIKVVQQTRELVAAIRKFTTSETCAKAFDVLHRVLEETDNAEDHGLPQRELWNCEAEITLLVIKELELRDSCHNSGGSHASSLLAAIKQYIYGPSKIRLHLPLMTLVYSQSFVQASRARQVCLKLVKAQLSVVNCFQLFCLSDALDLPYLRNACQAIALDNFPEASDSNAFCGLTYEQLMSFIRNSQLQVAEEVEVFRSCMRWIQADVKNRQKRLTELLEHGIRLELMGRSALIEVDAHPLVLNDRAATRLVANAFMHACYGPFVPDDDRPQRWRNGKAQAAICSEKGAEERDRADGRSTSEQLEPQRASASGQKRSSNTFDATLTPSVRFVRPRLDPRPAEVAPGPNETSPPKDSGDSLGRPSSKRRLVFVADPH